MTDSQLVPPGGFPRAIRGYSAAAVDETVGKLSSRLESLVSQLQQESSRADESKRLLEQMTAELDIARRRATDAEKREAAAAEASKRAEEEASRLAQELKEARERSRSELEGALADARQQRDALLEEERREAEARAEEAHRAAAAQVAEAHRQLEAQRQETAAFAVELEALRSRTGGVERPGAGRAKGGRMVEAQASAEIEQQRAHVREEVERLIADARREVEVVGASAAAAFAEQEARIRAMSQECEALVRRIREAVESPVTLLPAHPARPAVGAAPRSVTRGDEPDEKRMRSGREWRTGNWRKMP
jgi:colicin import membrane protein